MPSLFGKSHLSRYDIQGGAKSHYLVFVHLPCLHTQLKQYFHLSLLPLNVYDQEIIECLMNYNSQTNDCLNYLFQRLQIRDKSIYHYFGLTYFNKINKQSYWLDPNLSMRQQIPKAEIKPNLTFTYLIYPAIPYSIQDEKARLILYQQLFCNFISSIYSIEKNSIDLISAYFLAACFANRFHPDKNRDLLQMISSVIGCTDEKLLDLYRDLSEMDNRLVQDQFAYQISQTNNYGMICLELKNSLNEAICLGLNHHGVHSRSLLRTEYKLETCWHTVTSIASNKQRQITLSFKNGSTSRHSLIYYTDSTNYNRYCLRILNVFYEYFSKYSTNEVENIPKLPTPTMRLHHGVSVPDLRSDGESSSNDRTPPSISSSTYSSNQSANLWKGSLPNLTVQLSTQTQNKQSQHPYATFADNLNQIEPKESIVPTMINDDTASVSVRSAGYKSQSSAYPTKFPHRSLTSIGLSCSLATFDKSSFQTSNHLSPCFSCECLDRCDNDLITKSPSISSATSRSLLNSRTYLSSTSVPLESDSISVHNHTQTDTWLAEFESKIASNTVYDEFDSIPLSRMNCSSQDGRFTENIYRNRYPDVIPYDDTRVRLIPTKENLHGYINASHVKVRIENTIYSYIAAESPLSSTVYDFWRMISGSNVHVIVMLLGNDRQLCANYFPHSKTEPIRTDEFEIELLSEQNRQDFHIRHLKMKFLNGQRTRTIVHLQYTSWDDAQLPLDTHSFLNFIHVVNSFRRHYGETNPCLVHCTAGIGRTGIFILIHVMIQCITFNKKVNVASVLKVMREHRMSLIDRTYSYVFVYRCLIDYLKSSRLI